MKEMEKMVGFLIYLFFNPLELNLWITSCALNKLQGVTKNI